MAVRKEKNTSPSRQGAGGRKSPGKGKPYSWAVLFWLVFAIFLFGFFLFNREAISKSIQIIQNEVISPKAALPQEKTAPETGPAVSPAPEPRSTVSVSGSSGQGSPASEPGGRPAREPPAASGPAPTEPSRQQPGLSGTEPAAPAPQAPQISPSSPAPAGAAAPPAARQSPQASQGAAELRDRALYFIQVDRGGDILRIKTSRKLPVSDSPMTDVIQALIAGPSADEKNRGLLSLIPPNTKILSATVRGDTAYISFNEDFQYNTYGVEGYAGQLRQVVFTATEFPNVTDVQILIEGRRVDYLGEGIWIGSPLNRDML